MKLPILALFLLISPVWATEFGHVDSNQPQTNHSQNRFVLGDSATVINLVDFGAVGDGTADDGPALQRALDALGASGGGTLLVPAGRYAIITPVKKDFANLVSAISILGVESSTPVPPINSPGSILTHGLDLVSEFAPRTHEQNVAINISGLQSFLIKDIRFIGTANVNTDALVTLALIGIPDATIRHCEFYGLCSLYHSIVLNSGGGLSVEQSEFLGSTGNSGLNVPVVQNVSWKHIRFADTIFADYGQSPELYGKLGVAPAYSWINVGNAAPPEPASPRREVEIRNVFLDEGAFFGITCDPNRYQPASAPIDLFYVSGLYLNVSNLQGSGFYLAHPKHVLVEKAHFGWSHNAAAAIDLFDVGDAILDQLECVDHADRIRADSATGNLFVIDSVYNYLDSLARQTKVITTTQPDDDPVQYVRRQFTETLGRDPDSAAHFYWSDQILKCGEDANCVNNKRVALNNYLAAAPAQMFAITGQVVDEGGAALSGVTVSLTGGQSVTTLTDSNGRYQFSNLPTSGVYTVTPAKTSYSFVPATQTFQDISADQTQNFSGHLGSSTIAISGRVTLNQNSLSGITIKLSGTQSGSTTTDANGNYSFNLLAGGGNFTVTPEKEFYSFSPSSVSFTNLGASQVANFDASYLTLLEFDKASYSVSEASTSLVVNVERQGNTTGVSEVIYSANDGSAQQRSDVIPVIGRLRFEPGEVTKSFTVLITDDTFIEGPESLTLKLDHLVGGIPGSNSIATLNILDDDSSAAPNPIDDADFFVRENYRDFLNRNADAEGLAFWSNQIISCGTNAACIEDRRINVSAAFFLSIEFQQTGFLVYRLYEASFGRQPEHVAEFLLDTRTIGEGVVVNAPGWEQLLENNKTAFIESFVARPQFSQAYPLGLTPLQFVSRLNATAGNPLTEIELAAAVGEFAGAATSEDLVARGRVLRRIAESESLTKRELNPAFVLMQYFGYLQRNPSEFPDHNTDGYNFWLNKLNQFGGDFRAAEMVKAFLVSTEYRARFGAP